MTGLYQLLLGSSAKLLFEDGTEVLLGLPEAFQLMTTLREEGWEMQPTGVEEVSPDGR